MSRQSYLKALVMLGFLLATVIPALPDEIYSYAGPTLSTCVNTPLDGIGCYQLTNNGGVDITFDVSSPLGADFSGIVDPNSWTVSGPLYAYSFNGTSYYDNYDNLGPVANSAVGGSFDIQTDANGDITAWTIIGHDDIAFVSNYDMNGFLGNVDQISANNCSPSPIAQSCLQTGATVGADLGAWSYSPDLVAPISPAPEPVWDALIALCVFGPAGWYQRRRLRQSRERIAFDEKQRQDLAVMLQRIPEAHYNVVQNQEVRAC